MTQYGDYQEPSIITEVTSALGVPTAGDAPGDMGLVGQANLGDGIDQGSADPNTVYQVENDDAARNWFGDESTSFLTRAILDAFTEGAYPVYAVAPESSTNTYDMSGSSSTTVDLPDSPISEDPAELTVTLDGADLSVNKVYDDVSTHPPADDECYFNPVRSTVEIPSVPGDSDDTNDTVEYTTYDYPSAHDAMAEDGGEVVDFFAPLNEATSVVNDAQTTVGDMAQEYELAVMLGGADIRLNPSDYENPYDDSRTQLVYPTRFADGSSALAAYAGKRAALGINTTPVRQRFESNKRLAVSLSRAERGTLIEKNVVPLADEAGGARIVDDPTCVTDENTDEANLQYGFERLVMDYIITTTRSNQQPFIGRLNRPAVRNTLEQLINSELSAMESSNLILDFDVSVSVVDATTARLDINVDTAEPLRFIENQVQIGQATA